MRAFAGALFLLATTSAQAQTPTKFDVICTGQSITTSGNERNPAKPDVMHYVVDLDRGLWCGTGCDQPQAISNVTDDTITLKSSKSEMIDSYIDINRFSGAFTLMVAMQAPQRPLTTMNMTGQCGAVSPTATCLQ